MAKTFKPTKEQRDEVERNICAGIELISIAHMVGLSRDMLQHYFPDEIKFGRARKLAQYIALLERAAIDLNVAAIKKLIDIGGLHTSVESSPPLGKKEAAALAADTATAGSVWSDLRQIN